MTREKDHSQLSRFKEAARELECDESGKAFGAALQKIADAAERCFRDEAPGPPKKPKKPKA